MNNIWWQTKGQGNVHLVLLHGWGLNAEVWRCIDEELSSHFTLHLVDLPGFGRSRGFGAMSLADMAEAVLRQAPDKAIWLGWSLGGLVASHMPTLFLKVFFICFLAFVAVQMLSSYRPPATREMPGALGTAGAGGVIGLISSFVGIGGGTLSVPFMSYCNVPLHHAVGTSAALGFPIAVAGTLSYIIGGWQQPDLPAGCFGFVHLLALVGIAVASFCTAPLGAKLSHALPTSKLKKAFAVFLIIVDIRMIVALL